MNALIPISPSPVTETWLLLSLIELVTRAAAARTESQLRTHLAAAERCIVAHRLQMDRQEAAQFMDEVEVAAPPEPQTQFG